MEIVDDLTNVMNNVVDANSIFGHSKCWIIGISSVGCALCFFLFQPKTTLQKTNIQNHQFDSHNKHKQKFLHIFWTVFVYDSKPRAEGSFSSLREKKTVLFDFAILCNYYCNQET